MNALLLLSGYLLAALSLAVNALLLALYLAEIGKGKRRAVQARRRTRKALKERDATIQRKQAALDYLHQEAGTAKVREDALRARVSELIEQVLYPEHIPG